MKNLSWVGVLLLSLSAALAAPISDPVEQLQHVGSFAVGGIGIAGTTSEGERALRVLLADPAATTQLQSLLSNATPAGRLYALLGLRLHDRAVYEGARKAFRVPEVEVETIGGCIISRAPFKQLLDRIEAGQYDPVLERPAR